MVWGTFHTLRAECSYGCFFLNALCGHFICWQKNFRKKCLRFLSSGGFNLNNCLSFLACYILAKSRDWRCFLTFGKFLRFFQKVLFLTGFSFKKKRKTLKFGILIAFVFLPGFSRSPVTVSVQNQDRPLLGHQNCLGHPVPGPLSRALLLLVP